MRAQIGQSPKFPRKLLTAAPLAGGPRTGPRSTKRQSWRASRRGPRRSGVGSASIRQRLPQKDLYASSSMNASCSLRSAIGTAKIHPRSSGASLRRPGSDLISSFCLRSPRSRASRRRSFRRQLGVNAHRSRSARMPPPTNMGDDRRRPARSDSCSELRRGSPPA